jgi:isoquinoline 1-oxidoreductase beta subunit
MDTTGVERADSAHCWRAIASWRGNRTEAFRCRHGAPADAPRKISAEFAFPHLAHAPMEPLNCTVAFDGQEGGALDGTQSWLRRRGGEDPRRAGGGQGEHADGWRRSRRAIPTSDYVVEACQVAKAARSAGVAGPVRTL